MFQEERSSLGLAESKINYENERSFKPMNHIDYKSSSFILKNLSIASSFDINQNTTVLSNEHTITNQHTDKYHVSKQDISKTNTYSEVITSENSLKLRNLYACIISHQILFYIGCTLKLFVLSKKKPVILLYGTGYIGMKVIHHLISFGLSEYLRICTRQCEEVEYFRERGIIANTDLVQLLTSPDTSTGILQKIDIIILNIPLQAYDIVSKQFKSLIDHTTILIYSTFGLSRLDIFKNLKIASILRTFQDEYLISHIKTKLSDSDKIDYSVLSATILCEACDVIGMISVLENYYALHGMPHALARYEALSCALCHQDKEYSSSTSYQKDLHRFNMYLEQLKENELESRMSKIDEELENSHSVQNLANLEFIFNNFQNNLFTKFHEIFSKFIRIVDIPRVSQIQEKIELHKLELSLLDKRNHDSNNRKRSSQLREARKYSNTGARTSLVLMEVTYNGSGYPMHSNETIRHIFKKDLFFNQIAPDLRINENHIDNVDLSICSSNSSDSDSLDSLEYNIST